MQQARLISNAEYPGQSISRFNAEPVIPFGNPGRPKLFGQHVWVAVAPKLYDKTCASLGRWRHLFFADAARRVRSNRKWDQWATDRHRAPQGEPWHLSRS